MADEDTNLVDLAALHEAMKTAFQAAFEGVTVDYYWTPSDSVTLPAIFFNLYGIMPDTPDDIGTQQWACILQFSAFVTTTYELSGKLVARALALALGSIINGNRFGSPVGPGKIATIVEDQFQVNNSDYNVMRVDWVHPALIGQSVWQGTNHEVPPNQVYLGFAPLIGPDHINDYAEITPQS